MFFFCSHFGESILCSFRHRSKIATHKAAQPRAHSWEWRNIISLGALLPKQIFSLNPVNFARKLRVAHFGLTARCGTLIEEIRSRPVSSVERD
jgi:hypothetical protein